MHALYTLKHTQVENLLKIMAFHCFLNLFFFSLLIIHIVEGVVPPSQTFSYVNAGEFGVYINEYDATYRHSIDIFRSPFQLMFYNTTPYAYTLALRMGTTRSESNFYWVWEANRGNPVGDNATFSLGPDGNLVLADADGRVAFQSHTANKGVVGFELLPNGNMVLYDSKGSFVWQSFDYPTDTLLLGQSLRLKGPIKLVSRLSVVENKDGPYSLVVEPNRVAMYYTTKNSRRPMLYRVVSFFTGVTIDSFTVNIEEELDGAFYRLSFEYPTRYGFFAQTNYNSTLSYLRLGIDGSLKLNTFYNRVDYQAWEETYTLFSREFGGECQLPERCGNFGLCEDSQCVGCPSGPQILGWTKSCQPPKLTSCKPKDIRYYKLEGVNHFLSRYTTGSGPMKEEDCSKKCSSDCKCLGFFFKRAESRCWIVYDLKTLRKVDNSTHVGYIKAPII